LLDRARPGETAFDKETPMSEIPAFPMLRVGEPIRHEALIVFPLFRTDDAFEEIDYHLASEAVAEGSIVVEEVSESGSVPTLLVTNQSEHRVLFLEGEELRGAKQNRVLNTSVLVAAKSKTTIPVSCVEQGRWRFRSHQFASSDMHSSPKLRKHLKESVFRSLSEGSGHASDQGAVWTEVDRQMRALKSSSMTMAMSDTYESHRARVDEYRASLGYVSGATGLAVAIGPTVVGLDLFDKPATCQKVWDRLLSGFIMNALEANRDNKEAAPAEVGALLQRLAAAPWQESEAVGEGREFRAEAGFDTPASALTFGSSVLHASAMAEASARD
jgi:hypothetical protein